MNGNERLQKIIGIILGLIVCIAVLLAVPKFRAFLEKENSHLFSEMSDIFDLKSKQTRESSEIYTVTLINNSEDRMKVEKIGQVSPNSRINGTLSSGFHRLHAYYYNEFADEWISNGTYDVEIKRDIELECDYLNAEETFISFLYGLLNWKHSLSKTIKCKAK